MTAATLSLGVPLKVSESAPFPMPLTSGCLVSPCGKCSPTVMSPGLVSQEDRYRLAAPSKCCFDVFVEPANVFADTFGMRLRPLRAVCHISDSVLWCHSRLTLFGPDIVACGAGR